MLTVLSGLVRRGKEGRGERGGRERREERSQESVSHLFLPKGTHVYKKPLGHTQLIGIGCQTCHMRALGP